MKFQFLPENFSRSENAPPFETRKIRHFEVERIFLENKKMVDDFLIAAEDLPDDPERGDVILHAGLRYEVLAPNGEPVWRWSGTGRILRRIHTKEIGGA